ncbi:hypothetical protein PsorP6_014962 [Peronosclerospora sorghi]|uniref:Uncharacterized protein n=1 Tax=Peronosclerospora sorghi TaxID=230839 RepID=A0ACC0VQQ1_9STRA|nr:hypothetical protein PsorP6_014962 [Peronosclerospora sorghi]
MEDERGGSPSSEKENDQEEAEVAQRRQKQEEEKEDIHRLLQKVDTLFSSFGKGGNDALRTASGKEDRASLACGSLDMDARMKELSGLFRDGVDAASTCLETHRFAMGLSVLTQGTYANLLHGGDGGGKAFHEIEMGETMKKVEVAWGEHQYKTWILYVKLSTIASEKSLAAGQKTSHVATVKPLKGYTIGGFHGRVERPSWYLLCRSDVDPRSRVQDRVVTGVLALTDTRNAR